MFTDHVALETGVLVELTTGRVVISWDVFHAVVLHPDGTVRLAYPVDLLDSHPSTVVVGLAPGGGAGPQTAFELSKALPASVPAGAVYEEFPVVDNGFDLAWSRLTFTPSGSRYDVAAAPSGLEPATGAPVALGQPIALPFPARLLGAEYGSVFVNPEGDLTFGAPSPRRVGLLAFLAGPRRAAPLFAPLRPDRGGSVLADVAPDRLLVSWVDVPGPGGAPVTFQAHLVADGTIAFTDGASTAPSVATVGLSAGRFPLDVTQADYSSGPLRAATSFELFAAGFYAPIDLVGHRLPWTPTASGGLAVTGDAGGFDPLGDARTALVGTPTAVGCADFAESCENPVTTWRCPSASPSPSWAPRTGACS